MRAKLTICYSKPELLTSPELPLNVAEAEDTSLLFREQQAHFGNRSLHITDTIYFRDVVIENQMIFSDFMETFWEEGGR